MYIEHYEGRDLTGTVLRFEKSSIYDGDGMRTVVFLKGCPLKCAWCSTPESQKMGIESTQDGSITYGKVMTVEEVMVEVRKDSLFYFHSGGGMTMSGGEIMLQPDFTRAVISRARYEGINTCFETSFYADWEVVKPIVDKVHTGFVDLKFFDEANHLKYTGVSNKRILENIEKAGTQDSGSYKLIIRTPLIPGLNDSEEELEEIAKFVAKLPRVHHWQLLPYHKLGTDTYRKLGIPYQLPDIQVPSKEHMDRCRQIIRRHYDFVI